MVTMNHCHIGFIVFVILPSALLAECPNVQTKRNFEIERVSFIFNEEYLNLIINSLWKNGMKFKDMRTYGK